MKIEGPNSWGKNIQDSIKKFSEFAENCKILGEGVSSVCKGLHYTGKNDVKPGGWLKACSIYTNIGNEFIDENNLVEMDSKEITNFCLSPELFEEKSLKTYRDIHFEEKSLKTYKDMFTTIIGHLSQKDGFMDVENIMSAIFGTGNKEFDSIDKLSETCVGITGLVNFATEGKYKDYLAETDVQNQSEKGIEQTKTCLDICDYMNLGLTANGDKKIQEPWTCVSEDDQLENNSDSQFFGKVYENEETKELIIAFCGTNSVDDITTDDVQMIKGKVPEQYEAALELYNKYANDENFKDYKITITGHSLGGALAQLVSSTEGVEADKVITFNAFGTYDIFNNCKDEYNFVENPDESKIFNFITEGDIVSTTARHLGQTTLIESLADDILNNHMLQSMHYYLEQKSNQIG